MWFQGRNKDTLETGSMGTDTKGAADMQGLQTQGARGLGDACVLERGGRGGQGLGGCQGAGQSQGVKVGLENPQEHP